MTLIGIAAIIATLAGAYYVIKRLVKPTETKG